MRDVWRTDEEHGLCGGAEKRVEGVSPGPPQSFRYQRRQVNDCSLGRVGMAQDGGTRGGTCHGKMNPRRKRQGWKTACSSICPNVTESIARNKRALAGSLAI